MSPIEIALTSGCVRGEAADGSVRSWKGIPYARPPVGPRRWRPPEPVEPWQGIRPATAFGPDCPQAPLPPSRAPAMSEDCLYLNVWSPADAAPASLPVMVWLPGGGFVGGSAADARSDGTRLAARGVVVVGCNYRTGLFGYLAHPGLSRESPQGVSGNYGLLDQIAALLWVQENIAAFGGDPAQVTIFGVSAGSASISLLLTAPAAKGLFHQAILHSPGCGRPLASLAQAEAAGTELAADLDALRALDPAQLLALTAKINPPVRGLTLPRVLRPIHDGWLLVDDEVDAFAAGRLHAMPLIVGNSADEGTQLTRNWPIDSRDAWHRLIASNFPHDVEGAMATWPAASDDEARRGVADAFADTQFNYGARLLLRSMVPLEPRCWRYRFTRRRPGRDDGPHHGDDVAYAFGHPEVGRDPSPEPVDDDDRRLATTLADAWVRFAATGDPNGAGLPDWPRYQRRQERLLQVDAEPGIVPDRLATRLDFLERYFTLG